jgi:Gram-negative bacterial TonB protein C-terminal
MSAWAKRFAKAKGRSLMGFHVTKKIARMLLLMLAAATASVGASQVIAQPKGSAVVEPMPPIKVRGLTCTRPMLYPINAIRQEATGTTSATYEIQPDGSVSNIQVVQSAGPTRDHRSLDTEVVLALRSCTATSTPPAGRPVSRIDFVWKLEPSPQAPNTPNRSTAPSMAPALSLEALRKVEETMAEWLSHPAEFGVRPTTSRYRTTIATTLAGSVNPANVHVVEFVMPDGTYGRGFVNPVTWAFLGPLPYDRLSDAELVRAYAGWLAIFNALRSKRAKTDFEPETQRALHDVLAAQGIENVVINEKYRLGSSELFEFVGTRGGKPVKGAGGAPSVLILDASDAKASLPVLYTYLGQIVTRTR